MAEDVTTSARKVGMESNSLSMATDKPALAYNKPQVEYDNRPLESCCIDEEMIATEVKPALKEPVQRKLKAKIEVSLRS